jgi:hypothetical protein
MPRSPRPTRAGKRPTRLLSAILAALAALLLSGATLGAAPAGASVDPGQKWVGDSIKAQLARHPGGIVSGNSIHYVQEDVTLTYKPATAPGEAVPADYAGCSSNEVCLYTTTSVVASGIRLSTGSLWCPWEKTNSLLDLRKYGLANQVRSADNESALWAEGIWSKDWVQGEQWKMDPYGILFNLNTNNITFLNVCLKEGDLEY